MCFCDFVYKGLVQTQVFRDLRPNILVSATSFTKAWFKRQKELIGEKMTMFLRLRLQRLGSNTSLID